MVFSINISDFGHIGNMSSDLILADITGLISYWVKSDDIADI